MKGEVKGKERGKVRSKIGRSKLWRHPEERVMAKQETVRKKKTNISNFLTS